jgi:hypothetical protein
MQGSDRGEVSTHSACEAQSRASDPHVPDSRTLSLSASLALMLTSPTNLLNNQRESSLSHPKHLQLI